jgi:rhodanese-related sulfurtransferase
MKALSVEEFKRAIKENTIILDTRNSAKFTHGFIPNSISIGLDGRFAEWAGTILSFDQPILLVAEPGKEKESLVRLARVGYDKMEGYLDGGYDAWQKAGEAIDLIIDVEPDELIMDKKHDDKLIIVDVRKENEFADGHLKGALNFPVQTLLDPVNVAAFEEDQNIYVHCAGGYRSVIAASLLKRQGIHNLRNVLGGWSKIKLEEGADIQKSEVVKL